MSDERMDPRFRDAVREELERLPSGAPQRAPAHRPWFAPVVTVVVAAIVVGVSVLALRVAPHPAPASPSPSSTALSPVPSPTPTTALGPVVATFAAPASGDSAVYATSDEALYIATSGQNDGAHWTLRRVDVGTGAVVTRRLDLPWLHALVVGPDGLYATTSVIERYASATPDTVLRLDPQTLATRATLHPGLITAQDSGLELATAPTALYLISQGGGVARLDPRSLRIVARTNLLTSKQLQDGDFLSHPLFVDGRLWVQSAEQLTALDPATFATVDELPFTGELATLQQHGFAAVGLGGDLVLLGQEAVVHVPASGAPLDIGAGVGQAVSTPFLVHGDAAVVLGSGDGERLALLDADGRIISAEDGGASILAASTTLLWVQGLPSHPDELAAIRVDVRQLKD